MFTTLRENTIMRSTKVWIGVVAALTGFAWTSLGLEGDANACGGCFVPTENPTVVTDHKMIFSVSKQQSTLYDQITYQGDPASFGWVLPISGTVDVGLSADVVFSGLNSLTTTSIVPPPRNCPSQGAGGSSSGGFGGAAPPNASPNDGVNVLKKEVVGPYETVQLQATTPNALQTWLAQNGFNIPADVQPVIATYQSENFNFLAMKLQPGKGIKDMRPVRVTTQGASIALPLRMVAAGTGPIVGITLWIVGEGRYEPQNFNSFLIKAEDLTWDWNQSKSNYTELRAQKTTEGQGRVWEIESSMIQYRQNLEGIVKQGTWNGTGPVPQTDDERAAQDYLPVTDAQGSVVKTAAQIRDEDMNTLFYGIPTATSRITRLRADLAHDALKEDLVLRAAGDQGTIQNTRQLTKSVGDPCNFGGGGSSSSSGASSSGTPTTVTGSGSTFTCMASRRADAGITLGLGAAAVALARLIRRKRS